MRVPLSAAMGGLLLFAAVGVRMVEPAEGRGAHPRLLARQISRPADPDEEEAWSLAANRARDPNESYDPSEEQTVWTFPPQEGFPGARIIEGSLWHRATCEAHRQDLRVLVFAIEGLSCSTVSRLNANSPDVHLFRSDDRHEALVMIHGSAWRAGTFFSVLAWDLTRGGLRPILDIGGEEGGRYLSWSMATSEPPILTLRGLWPSKRGLDVSREREELRHFGIELQLVFDAH